MEAAKFVCEFFFDSLGHFMELVLLCIVLSPTIKVEASKKE